MQWFDKKIAGVTSWIGWLLPGLLVIVVIATLVYNERRVRVQRFGVAGERRAAPTRLVAGYAVVSAIRWLGIVMVIAVIVLLVQGRALTSTFWIFAVIALVLTIGGIFGARRLGTALRRARNPFD